MAVVALYTNESKDRVREAVDFVELVSARTELRRAGPARYEGLCPFHDERTPSFGIDPAQKVYHCFGCQASGDVFTFVQETEGLDFKGALELLAERYGVELQREQEDPREAERRRRRERLLELLARTSAYYERYLWESSEAKRAREYLSGQGPLRGDPQRVPGGLRTQRVGPRADGLAQGRDSQSRSCMRRGWRSAPSRTVSPTTASARASCSRSATSAGGCSGSARARCAMSRRPRAARRPRPGRRST